MSADLRVKSSPSVSIGSDSGVVRRAVAVVGLIGIALIHLIDVPDKLEELPYVGIMFIALIVSSLVIAALLIHRDQMLVWLAGGALGGLTILGYVVSRTIGLPGDDGADLGNWTEPLGVSSLLVEGIVLMLALAYLVSRPRDDRAQETAPDQGRSFAERESSGRRNT